MTFSIEHDFDDLFEKMHKLKVFNNNTFTSILKKTVKPLLNELDRSGPDSLRSYANAASGNYSKAAAASRAKYGELQKSLGAYKSRTTRGIGEHSVNVGYLVSKQDKAFVAHFLNYGWRESRTGKSITTRHKGWMQRAEKNTLDSMKAIFDSEVENTFEANMREKWAKSQMRKKK